MNIVVVLWCTHGRQRVVVVRGRGRQQQVQQARQQAVLRRGGREQAPLQLGRRARRRALPARARRHHAHRVARQLAAPV